MAVAFEQLDVPTAASLLDEVISLWSSRKSEHSGFFRSGVFGARSPLATNAIVSNPAANASPKRVPRRRSRAKIAASHRSMRASPG